MLHFFLEWYRAILSLRDKVFMELRYITTLEKSFSLEYFIWEVLELYSWWEVSFRDHHLKCRKWRPVYYLSI